jgi:Rha family phage regulatory protein
MSNLPTTFTSPEAITMTSREVAELTGKDHRNVMRDIREMLEQLEMGVLNFEHTYLHTQNGRSFPIFKLPKDLTITLVSGYSVPMRHKIVTHC